MQFPTIDPDSEWTEFQLEVGHRIVGIRVDKDNPKIAWLEVQYAVEVELVIADLDLTFDVPE